MSLLLFESFLSDITGENTARIIYDMFTHESESACGL